MLMVIISVLLLGAAGGGGWFVYTQYLSEPAEESAEPTEAEAEEEKPADPFLVRLTPLTVPVVRDNNILQYITLMLQIEAVDRDSEAMMVARMPALRDAIITELYGGLGESDALDGDLIAVKAVKRKIRAGIARVVGPDRVHNILITDVNQRKL